MTRYTATIHHHSISKAPIIDAGETIASAKRRATAEFGGGFVGHTIIIRDRNLPEYPDNIVAKRVIGGKWVMV